MNNEENVVIEDVFCISCGSKNSNKSNFCFNCGHELKKDSGVVANQENKIVQQPDDSFVQKILKKDFVFNDKIIFRIIGFLISFFIAIVYLFIINSNIIFPLLIVIALLYFIALPIRKIINFIFEIIGRLALVRGLFMLIMLGTCIFSLALGN